MDKRSRRRTRDLVTQPASQGLSENENGCARISIVAKSANALFTGRIQKRKTNHLQIVTFGLQRAASEIKTIGGQRFATSGLVAFAAATRCKLFNRS